MKTDKPDPYAGVQAWVRDYRLALRVRNPSCAEQLRRMIALAIEQLGLDEAVVWAAGGGTR